MRRHRIPRAVANKLRSGYYRRLYGLETDSGSMYHDLRVNKGLSDAEAQYLVFKSRGLINKNPVDVQGIYDELMETSKSFRESTPRSRETRVKRVHTLRMKKAGVID